MDLLFSSIPFLYDFLPLVLLIYCIVPSILKNTVLLASSLLFYGWGGVEFVRLMVAAILLGYLSGLLIERFRGRRLATAFLVVALVGCLGMLGYFKYANFFLENFSAATGISVPALNIVLPIGISFYTFQILGYVIDVYRGDTKAQKNPLTLGAYISMFPQLIAGPIIRYADVAEQMECRRQSFEKAASGARRFLIGLGKKVLLANVLGEVCAAFKNSDEKSVLFLWLYAIAFTLQIYFDFSGYSDMAVGLGRILGFEFMENFDYPYISGSITEFWRRWHISLGFWFRDYVYIPLGGNRVPRGRWLFNILVVWFLTGFWHGAAWNFIAWGLWFALLLVAEKFWISDFLKKSRVFKHIYVLFFVMLGFVLFDASNLTEAVASMGGLFGLSGLPAVSAEALYYLRGYAGVFCIAAVGATPLPRRIIEKIQAQNNGEKILNLVEPVFLVFLLLVVTAYLVDGSFNPFLYFRF